MALARLLHEQERAHYLVHFGGVDPTQQSQQQQQMQQRGSESDSLRADESDDDDDDAMDGGEGSGNSSGMDVTEGGGGDAEEDESLALARMLMEEEEREWNARMLALAGEWARGGGGDGGLKDIPTSLRDRLLLLIIILAYMQWMPHVTCMCASSCFWDGGGDVGGACDGRALFVIPSQQK